MAATLQKADRRYTWKVTLSSFLGNTLEYYDFLVYGTAAAVVFPKIFFPDAGGFVATLAAFGTFAVGFLARPLGGLFFGNRGDTRGRKSTLMVTLTVMGLSTVLIGLLPSYGTIGVWAPVALVVLRLLQGFAVGGEWGGSMIIVLESAPPNRRGFFSAWPNTGGFSAQILITAIFAYVYTLPDHQLLSWGWRIPFLLSAVVLGVTFWMRRSLHESPVFTEAVAADPAGPAPEGPAAAGPAPGAPAPGGPAASGRAASGLAPAGPATEGPATGGPTAPRTLTGDALAATATASSSGPATVAASSPAPATVAAAVPSPPPVPAAAAAGAHGPIRSIFVDDWRNLLLIIGLRFAEALPYFLLTVFALSYGTDKLGLSKSTLNNAILVAAVVAFVSHGVFAAISDRIGRRPIYFFGAVVVFVMAFPFFAMLRSGSFLLIALGYVLVLNLGHNAINAIQPAFFAELFPADRRYTGAAAGREIASVLSGGLTPFIATALAGSDGSRWPLVAGYVMVGALITMVAVWKAPESFRRDLSATGETVR